MNTKDLIRYLLFGLLMTLPLVMVNAQDKKEKKKKKPERFAAMAQGVSGAVGGKSVFLNFVVNHFTTNEEKLDPFRKETEFWSRENAKDYDELGNHRRKSLFVDPAESERQQTQTKNDADIAKKLANPVAALISVPIQVSYDRGFGASNDGSRLLTNIQPVIPFSLSDDWNLISRTIVPISYQKDIPIVGNSDTGIGDILQSFFFSPRKPTKGGLVWGAGPVILLPTATNAALGAKKWGKKCCRPYFGFTFTLVSDNTIELSVMDGAHS